MSLQGFIHKLNWRLIAIHLIAAFFFVGAVKNFTFLSDIEMIELFEKYGSGKWLGHMPRENSVTDRITYFANWTKIFPGLIGLMTAFLISLFIVKRNQLFWANSFVMFVIALLLNRLGIFDNSGADYIYFSFSKLISKFGIVYAVLINGSLLLSIGFFIFFNKWTKNFVNRLQVIQNNQISIDLQ